MALVQLNAGADWTRAQWIAYADALLDSAKRWASPNNARITPPGSAGGYGREVDGLEGFARTFLLAGFRIAGERGDAVDGLVEFYLRGITAGVDPTSPERWVRLDEHAQAKVEAASLALILDMTRPWIWDRLDQRTRERLIDYLSPVVGDRTYPQTNWLWFRVVVQTFLRSVGGPWSAQDVADDLALHDSLLRADGWISDGSERSYDHYVGWALHLYPILWSRMLGAAELAGGRTAHDVARLDRYLQDAIDLVGANGSPLLQGRSLVYRFAAAAPFWAGVLAEVPSLSAGRLRHAAGRVVSHFAERGAPDSDGLLTLGWHGTWRKLAQGYSGPGSPYWAVKGLLGVSLPADHPVWSAPAEPLPVELGDTVRRVVAPGWIISGTRRDGIVRIVNHGTDHAEPGDLVGDSPLYARIGYSTATAPLHDGRAWWEPLEQSAALIDENGRATHRAGMQLLGTRVDGAVAVAASLVRAHWIHPGAAQLHHGAGITGEITLAGRLTVQSVVRGPHELRLVRVDTLAEGVAAEQLRLRIGGWPVAADTEPTCQHSAVAASVCANGVTSSITAITPAGTPAIARRTEASPLGKIAAVPTAEYPMSVGEWTATLISLDGTGVAGGVAPRLSLQNGTNAEITWPDGTVTHTELIDSRSAESAGR